MPVFFNYSWHFFHCNLSFCLSLRSSIHHCGQRSNGWEVPTSKKHNQMMAKATTAATSSTGD